MKLTIAALRAGFGEVKWTTATAIAAWDESKICLDACCEADEPKAGEILEAAESLANDRRDEFFDVSLLERCSWLLTYAAAELISAHAKKIIADNFAKEREAAEAIERRIEQVMDSVEIALRVSPADWRGSASSNSAYLRYRGISIRVSDHKQKLGGGWNEGTGNQYGDCDLQFLTNTDLPTTAEIRKSVCEMLRTTR